MIYRQLGCTGIKLSAVAFGAWAIGGWSWGGNDKKDSINAVKKSFEMGVTTLDTAPVYGFGLSETLIAEAVRGSRDKYQILTKCGIRWDIKNDNMYFESKDNEGRTVTLYKNSAKESIIEECEKSLKRLETDYIDLYQIHWHDSTAPIEDSMEAFDILLKQGKIRSGGVCNYSLDNLIKASAVFNIASDQIPYSMIKRDYEADVIPYCSKNNIGIVAYSPLQRGFLAGKIKHGHKFSDGDNRENSVYNSPENVGMISELTDKLAMIASERNVTLPQLVINWTAFRSGITIVLAGARDAVQAGENAASLDFSLKEDELKIIDQLIMKINIKI